MNSLFKTVTCANDVSGITSYAHEDAAMTQQILIKDLGLDMFIGVLDDERKAKQRVIVSLSIDVAPSPNWRNDDVNDVVSYADVIDNIKEIAERGAHIDLVETFAHMIIENCFQNPQINSVDVSVLKPDIIQNTSSVGVRISKAR